MSESQGFPSQGRAVLCHAGEVAQWTVLLLGWLWLGEQGMRLGWSVASGVLAVALWWATRLLCRGSAWVFHSSSLIVGLSGLLTAWGVWLPDQLSNQELSHTGLLFIAVLWGVWSGLIETRNPVSTFQLGAVAWHPLLAAVFVGAVWFRLGGEPASPWGVSMLLAACALVLYARDQVTACGLSACRGLRVGLQNLLAPSAMGLMMGSLWLGNAWCAGLGWNAWQMVGVHLALMAGLPALVAFVLRWLVPLSESSALRVYASPSLLVLGALMCLGDTAVHGVLAMLLPSLAWAVHCGRNRLQVEPIGFMTPVVSRGVAFLLGPVMLVCVGVTSPMQGPLAVQMALFFLGALAAVQWVFLWRQKQYLGTPLYTT